MKKEEIVRKGYDEIALKFKEFRNIFDNLQELEHLATLLPEKAKVLDVGCGIGIPVARFFVDYGFSVTGIDISERMVELAKQNVPKAEFFQYDMNELVFPDNAFHCITAVYSLFHVPREKHFSILKNFHRMLKQEGILFFCVGHLGGDDTDEFLGEEMF